MNTTTAAAAELGTDDTASIALLDFLADTLRATGSNITETSVAIALDMYGEMNAAAFKILGDGHRREAFVQNIGREFLGATA